jgi:hypothetical protein
MKNQRSCLLAVCAALAVPALTSAPVLAQPPPPAAAPPPGAAPAPGGAIDAASLARQRKFYDQGNKFYDEGKLPQAEAAYLEAWKIKKSFDVAGNLGNLEADMNRPRQAAEFLSFALREFPAGGKPALRDALVKRLAEMQQKVGTLRIQVNVPQAEVLLDGVSIGPAPIANEVFAEAGSHMVVARAEGYPQVQVTITVAKGKAQDVPITLVPVSSNKTLIYAGAGVAGLGVVLAGVFGGLSASKTSSASSQVDALQKTGGATACLSAANKAACDDIHSARQSAATFGNVAIYSAIGAGVVGGATAIYALTAGGSKRSSAVLKTVPIVTGDGGGVMLSGSF